MLYKYFVTVLGVIAIAVHGQFMGNNTIDIMPPFPDGVIPCTVFPSEYGAIPIGITKMGWSGLQYNGGNIDHIGDCLEDTLCSYHCPAGYSKAQYPAAQPASGESHGGLICKNGFLHRTRPEFPYLCEPGSHTAFVENKLPGHVAICRTDYPGTENMALPVSLNSGDISLLTSPIAETSYHTNDGGPTSAQYYLQKEGVSVEDGCRWSNPGGDLGNWAPIVIGAGFCDGMTWLSITQNPENPNASLGYNVRIVGKHGAPVSQDCRYEGEHIIGEGFGDGCTVSLEGLENAGIFQFY